VGFVWLDAARAEQDADAFAPQFLDAMAERAAGG
jgi:hypothetical protein